MKMENNRTNSRYGEAKWQQELRDHQREHYNTLQVKMDSIIARMQFKILLGKLAELGV